MKQSIYSLYDIFLYSNSASLSFFYSAGGGGFKKQTFKEHSSATEDSTPDILKNILCTPLQQLNSFPPGIKRLVKAVSNSYHKVQNTVF
jgi:hypothetical protein